MYSYHRVKQRAQRILNVWHADSADGADSNGTRILRDGRDEQDLYSYHRVKQRAQRILNVWHADSADGADSNETRIYWMRGMNRICFPTNTPNKSNRLYVQSVFHLSTFSPFHLSTFPPFHSSTSVYGLSGFHGLYGSSLPTNTPNKSNRFYVQSVFHLSTFPLFHSSTSVYGLSRFHGLYGSFCLRFNR